MHNVSRTLFMIDIPPELLGYVLEEQCNVCKEMFEYEWLNDNDISSLLII
jgi:hypothetical protein